MWRQRLWCTQKARLPVRYSWSSPLQLSKSSSYRINCDRGLDWTRSTAGEGTATSVGRLNIVVRCRYVVRSWPIKLVLDFISFLNVRRSVNLGLVSSAVRAEAAELAGSLTIVESLLSWCASQSWNLSTEAPPRFACQWLDHAVGLCSVFCGLFSKFVALALKAPTIPP